MDMDIRIEPMANLPHRGQEKADVVKDKQIKDGVSSKKKKEDDRTDLEAQKPEILEDRIISKEDLQNFMLLLVTSKSSPKMFNRFMDEKRKDRINTLLNTRV